MPKKSDPANLTLRSIGDNLPFLAQCKECLTWAYVSPQLFEEVINTQLPKQEALAIQWFSAEMAQIMSDEQKRGWRHVVLGMERMESESHSMQSGGLITGDTVLLTTFLATERTIANVINQQLSNTQLRDALIHATEAWKRKYPQDDLIPPAVSETTEIPAQRRASSSLPLRPSSLQSLRGKGTDTNTAQAAAAPKAGPRVSVAGGYPYDNSMPPEERVMWLQGLSWRLKFQQEGYESLLQWRDGLLRELDEYTARFKGGKKSLLESRKTLSSYLLIASNCRTRVCLSSPQCPPTAARALYADYVNTALEACTRVHQSSKLKTGVLSKLSRGKCELRDILVTHAADLKQVVVSDAVWEAHPSLLAPPPKPEALVMSSRMGSPPALDPDLPNYQHEILAPETRPMSPTMIPGYITPVYELVHQKPVEGSPEPEEDDDEG